MKDKVMFRRRGGTCGGAVPAEHGRWGEEMAAWWLWRNGYTIAERNARPCLGDSRLEIDIIAHDKRRDILVFVEVKQHAARSPYQSRLRSVDVRKKRLLLRACRSWLRKNRWRGSYRFDVIEVYGTPEEGRAEIDHIERVRLFEGEESFVNWY